ncbi:hypothetical protein D6D28_10639 [Aureobasidium pullulans]|uniref:Uncharacterized protein n=1 Tax=Aureobasidium pullulans TaxID=5580 RepID=A0A4S8RX50_AURPU|nr:hypothetical protein D6D28_10639 [Aureobasidium pullulans]
MVVLKEQVISLESTLDEVTTTAKRRAVRIPSIVVTNSALAFAIGLRESFVDFFAKYEEKIAYVDLLEILDKLSPRYRVKMNDGHDIDSLKVLIKRYYALDASFARANSYPKTSDNPRCPKNTSTIGLGSSPSGNCGRSFSNPPKPRTNDTRPNTKHTFARYPKRKNKTINLAAVEVPTKNASSTAATNLENK